MIALALLVVSGTAAGDDPPYYVRKPTWQATVRASREAQIRRSKADKRPYVMTEVLRGGDPGRRLEVDVRGWRELWLIVTDAGDYHNDVSNWADARLIDADGKVTWVDRLKPARSRQDWGKLAKNKSVVGRALEMAGRRFKRGLGTHANSEICFRLAGKYERFEAWVGIGASRAKGVGAVHFIVSPRKVGVRGVADDELWKRVLEDFPGATARRQIAWERADPIWQRDWTPGDVGELARRYAKATRPIADLPKRAADLAAKAKDAAALQKVRSVYYRSRALVDATSRLKGVNLAALRLAVEDLTKTFGRRYPRGKEFLARLGELEKDLPGLLEGVASADPQAEKRVQALLRLRAEALLANPLLDFDELLLIKRGVRNLGLPANWQSNSSLRKTGYDNEIVVLSPVRPDAALRTLFRPEGGKFVGDVDLHFDAERMLFSMPGGNGRWHVFEMEIGSRRLRQLTPNDTPDVDSYDACYLPDGRTIFSSTACFIGVPCVYGSSHVTNLYAINADGRPQSIRQLTFDQDHNWCPTVMNDGRVMYLRWEYTDTPHSQTRLLFSMNPDGTQQMELYGSNSYWPNSTFYARPCPDHPTKVVGVISGHHGVRRMGELILFDPARGRHEATGVVQRIPGYGQKVEPIIRDQLVNASWPKFLHPYPLSSKYFLVSCKPTAKSLWGLYLVDAFDNMLLLKELPGYALLEPLPLRKRPRPPTPVRRIADGRKDAIVYMTDVYRGDGLSGVPRGAVKKLRVFTYHFSYQGMGGLLGILGADGPWDIKRVVGTVPVEADGSAMFRVPANTPLAVHPLDAEGKALQRMRSWFTAMPGEVLSCVGCHERQNEVTPNRRTLAARKPPSEISPWYGPVRGFSFKREVQPVLDAYCVRCHDGQPREDGRKPPDLRGTVKVTKYRMVTAGNGANRGGKFSLGYFNLQRLVRRPGIESDYHLLMPLEYHADTTQLVQMLRKGHHGVRLDDQSWDRLITWIDLNAPYHGTWGEELHDPGRQRQRRRELRKLYAGIDEDPEAVYDLKVTLTPPPPNAPRAGNPQSTIRNPRLDGWPFDAGEAKRRQAALAQTTARVINLGDGVKMDLVLVPPGQFVMGSADGCADERPPCRVRVPRPFWIGRCEVSNEQYARFDPHHDSRVESKNAYQFGVHGYPMNTPPQPVVRISWKRALAFCRWLSKRTGRQFSLPTEAQWEWACRAGSDKAFSFGGLEADYSKFANVADRKLREFITNPYTVFRVYRNATPYDDWLPKDLHFDDGALLSVDIDRYQPNAWGLHNMHGNVAEWTRTVYRPYPYNREDGRDDEAAKGRRVVRGGSWRDRPKRCRSAFRLSYQPWQGVYNVGFRVVCEPPNAPAPVAAKRKAQ